MKQVDRVYNLVFRNLKNKIFLFKLLLNNSPELTPTKPDQITNPTNKLMTRKSFCSP